MRYSMSQRANQFKPKSYLNDNLQFKMQKEATAPFRCLVIKLSAQNNTLIRFEQEKRFGFDVHLEFSCTTGVSQLVFNMNRSKY